MKVKATKKGFYGTALRQIGDEFYFEEFEQNDDGINNLGSWMKPLEDLPKVKKKQVKKKPVIDEPDASEASE